MCIRDRPLIVDVPYLDYFVHANVWRVNVGRISLYLLDMDNEMNSEFDRPITHQHVSYTHLFIRSNFNRLIVNR